VSARRPTRTHGLCYREITHERETRGVHRVGGRGMATSLERHVDGMLRYPGLAKHDILWVYQNYHRLVLLETELVTLRAETEKYRKKLSTLQLSYEQECLSARSASSALANVEDMNARVRRMADLESKKARKAADERDKERLRVRHLKRLVTELEKDARNARGDGRGGEVLSAIRKLAKSPAVGKRLAAACHPDKAPPELNLVAAELFRLVQDMR